MATPPPQTPPRSASSSPLSSPPTTIKTPTPLRRRSNRRRSSGSSSSQERSNAPETSISRDSNTTTSGRITRNSNKTSSRKKRDLSGSSADSLLLTSAMNLSSPMQNQNPNLPAGTPTICLCHAADEEVDQEEVLPCSNGRCTTGWFHLFCVGVSEHPPMSLAWYCPECRKKVKGEKLNGLKSTRTGDAGPVREWLRELKAEKKREKDLEKVQLKKEAKELRGLKDRLQLVTAAWQDLEAEREDEDELA